MKNSFKLAFLALAISLSVAACSSDKKAMTTSDSTAVDTSSTTSTDSAGSITSTDKTKTDTSKKP